LISNKVNIDVYTTFQELIESSIFKYAVSKKVIIASTERIKTKIINRKKNGI